MTEGINVRVRRALNRFHAGFACVFWVMLGIVVFLFFRMGGSSLFSSIFGRDASYWISEKISWFSLILGIVLGIVRMFVINDKYAWDVAILDEIERVKSMVSSETSEIEEIKDLLKDIEIKSANSTKSNSGSTNEDL